MPGRGLNPSPEPLQDRLTQDYCGTLRGRDNFLTNLGFIPGPAMAKGSAWGNPRHVVRPARGTWVHGMNTMHGTCAGVETVTRKDVAMVLRDWGQRHLGVVSVVRNNRRASGHQMTSSGTPLRNYSISPPSTPPTRRRSSHSLLQAVLGSS
jgi:hypothetical protein